MTEPPPAGSPPKFIIVTHEFAPFRGGVATYVAEVATALQKLGAAVEVWAPDYGQPAVKDKFSFPVVRLRSRGSLRAGHLLQFARALAARRPELEKATVILGSVGAHMTMLLPAPLGLKLKTRVISLLHGSEVLRFERNPFWRSRANNLFPRVAAVVGNSEFTKSLVAKSFMGPLIRKLVIAPCACSSAAAREVSPPQRNDTQVRVFTLARIHPRKGQLETAHALGRLPMALRAQVVYQVGGTGDLEYLREVERACGETGVAFEYLGEIAEDGLAAAYAQCDIYAMTSRVLAQSVEGFGITYLDAGFHGKPVVGYRSGGVTEAVADGETGLLVEEANVDALAGAFGRLITDKDLRARLGAGGRKRAQQFGWDAATRVFLSLRSPG